MRASARRRVLALVVTSAGTFVGTLDGSITNTALPTIARDLHVSASDSIWVTNGYQLAVTATLLFFASLGDARGARRVYLAGLSLFTVASLGCALSHWYGMLVGLRILQGVGTSALIVTTQGLNRAMFPPSELGRAISVNSIFVAVGAASGPTLGGMILAIAPWQWLFLVNLPIGIVTVALGLRYLPRVPGTGASPDLVSALLAVVAIGSFISTLDGVAHRLAPAAILACALVAAVTMTAFIRRQLRLAQPLLAVELFRSRTFGIGIVASTFTYGAHSLGMVSLPFFFQTVLGRTPFESGLLILAWPATSFVFAVLMGPLSDRYSATALATLGMLAMGAGFVLFALLPHVPSVLLIVLAAAICGGGFATFQTPNIRSMIADVPPEKTGRATGVTSLARLTGQTTGAATVAVIFSLSASALSGRIGVPGRAGVEATFLTACGFLAFAITLSCVRLGVMRPAPVRRA